MKISEYFVVGAIVASGISGMALGAVGANKLYELMRDSAGHGDDLTRIAGPLFLGVIGFAGGLKLSAYCFHKLKNKFGAPDRNRTGGLEEIQ